jgi:hypothetical protein
MRKTANPPNGNNADLSAHIQEDISEKVDAWSCVGCGMDGGRLREIDRFAIHGRRREAFGGELRSAIAEKSLSRSAIELRWEY